MEELLEEYQNSNHPSTMLDSLIEQGNWFARTGRLDQSFRAFANAFRVGLVPKERISSLVEACLEFQRSKLSKERNEDPSNTDDSSTSEIFNCLLCNCVFMKPVTLACGHTFCEVCLSEEKSFTGFAECSKCGKVVAENTVFSVNVLVMNAIQKWLPGEYQKQEKKLQGYTCLIRNDIKSAIGCFTGVLSTSSYSNDFHCLSWRSDAFLRLGKLNLALRDIEQACKLRPGLARTFYRKAAILANFAKVEGILSTKHEESVLALLRCYALVPKCHRYREEFAESLHQLLSPKFTNLNRTLSVLKQNQSGGNELTHHPILHHLESSSKRTDSVSTEASEFATYSKGQMLAVGVGKRPETKTLTLAASNSGETSFVSEQDRGKKSVVRNGSPKAKSHEGGVNKGILHLREVEDFECKLCYNLLFQPITSICGHTFCRECLERCLDHRAECPCCRRPLDQYLKGTHKMAVTEELEKILVKYFPGDYNERMKKFNEKMNTLNR